MSFGCDREYRKTRKEGAEGASAVSSKFSAYKKEREWKITPPSARGFRISKESYSAGCQAVCSWLDELINLFPRLSSPGAFLGLLRRKPKRRV